MATKKAVLIHYEHAVANDDCSFYQKACIMPSYISGEYEGRHMAQSCTPKDVISLLQRDAAFLYTEVTSDDELNAIVEAADRKTTLAVATPHTLYFWGHGIKKSATSQRTAQARDIMPTLAYVAYLPVWPEATGAVLYQALKDPDMHVNEIQKLNTALMRMEGALARESREPWDKHDCA